LVFYTIHALFSLSLLGQIMKHDTTKHINLTLVTAHTTPLPELSH